MCPFPQAHETPVRAMVWSHSDAWLVSSDHGGYIKYWQSNMNNVKMYEAHKEPIRGLRSECHYDIFFPGYYHSFLGFDSLIK